MKNLAQQRPSSGPCPAPKKQKAAAVAKRVASVALAPARKATVASGRCPAPKRQKTATVAKLVGSGAPAQARTATAAKLVASRALQHGSVDISD